MSPQPPIHSFPPPGVHFVQIVELCTGKDGQQAMTIIDNIPIPPRAVGLRFAYPTPRKGPPSRGNKQVGTDVPPAHKPLHSLQNLSDKQFKDLLNDPQIQVTALLVPRNTKNCKSTNKSAPEQRSRDPNDSQHHLSQPSSVPEPIEIRSVSPEVSIPTCTPTPFSHRPGHRDKAERRSRSKSTFVDHTESRVQKGKRKKNKKIKNHIKSETGDTTVKGENGGEPMAVRDRATKVKDKYAKWSKRDPNWQDKAVRRWMQQDAVEANPQDDYVVLETDTEQERHAKARSVEL